MKILSKIKFGFITTLTLLTAVIFVFVLLIGETPSASSVDQADCEDCSKKRAGLYLGDNTADSKLITSEDTSYFGKIFALLKSGNGNSAENTIIERDPEKDKIVNEINALSEIVCNDEKLPGDIWISPRLIEKDAVSHKKELEKLIVYCTGLKNGKTSSADRREYYKIKIRLLEERRDLIKYYIETLDGQIEETNEKKIAEMEERKKDDALSPEEEKQNREIETETNRFFEEASANSDMVINQINSVIDNYKKELNKL